VERAITKRLVSEDFVKTKFAASQLVLLGALLVLGSIPAHATFPGKNGQITYVRFTPDGDEHVFVANPDGSNELQLFAMTSEGSDWSADGSRIAFDFFDGTTVQIGTINPDGSGFVQLTFDSAFHASPTWSPDGKRIAIDFESATEHGIQLIDASDGTVLLQVTSNPSGIDVEPQWSPDGQWIVFSRATGNRANRGRGTVTLFLVRPDGTGLHQLTPPGLNADFEGADWSPDGTKIAFSGKHNVPVNFGIWTIHPDGSGLTALIKGTPFAYFDRPTWSPDGTRLITHARLASGDSLWEVNADGSNLHQITGIEGAVGFPDWGTHPLQ
jgi:TolB protein